MQLKSMTAKNYRTLENLSLQFSKNYCTISGRNNAGKSCIIRLLSAVFRTGSHFPWGINDEDFDYKEDKTQWVKQELPIEIAFEISISKGEDPALVSFVEKIAAREITEDAVVLRLSYSIDESDEVKVSAAVDNDEVDHKAAKEIDKRIKDSNLLFLYNSTSNREDLYLGRGRRRMLYESIMSPAEKKALDEASKYMEKKLRRLAKEHTQDLGKLLGRLVEKYDVEVSPLEGFATRRMPLGINLRDRNVEVPLSDWGSGTQNRTQILMAILQANRIKTTGPPDEKITPSVVIEEPESFLHPSAQAEFGRLLSHLSSDLGIQIIVTTHSPHMLNQEEPASNILLDREVKRRKAFATIILDTSGDHWMTPFADHLGIGPDEFSNLRPLFSAGKSKVLLVEGTTDQGYFQFLQEHELECEKLEQDIEIVPYGGKDTLKNTLLIKFVLSNFDKVFVTYDLDADAETRKALSRVGLKEKIDYLPLGVDKPGKDCIEGLVPDDVLSTVNGQETDLVMELGSADSKARKKAKDILKGKYLDEFRSRTNYQKDSLNELSKAIKQINKQLCSKL